MPIIINTKPIIRSNKSINYFLVFLKKVIELFLNVKMNKIILVFLAIISLNSVLAQEVKANSADDVLKETIYKANKTKVLNYSLKDFEKLFFEFNDKKFDQNVLLSKEEFYTYTVKIAIFSDRLATLYPKEKEVAEASKKKWLSESYEDYLLSKPTQKK